MTKQQQTLINWDLINACQGGELITVRHLLTTSSCRAEIHFMEDFAFRQACGAGHLDIVQYLLTSPELSEHADINAQDDHGLGYACYNGHLQVVKYLLASPELSTHANIEGNQNAARKGACTNNHLDILKYLLTSPELSKHAKVHSDTVITPLNHACTFGHLPIVKYLLTSPELQEHSHLCARDSLAQAWRYNHQEVVTYLLYDIKIQVPEDCYSEFEDSQTTKEQLLHAVAKRDLFFKIHDNFQDSDNENPRMAPKPKV